MTKKSKLKLVRIHAITFYYHTSLFNSAMLVSHGFSCLLQFAMEIINFAFGSWSGPSSNNSHYVSTWQPHNCHNIYVDKAQTAVLITSIHNSRFWRLSRYGVNTNGANMFSERKPRFFYWHGHFFSVASGRLSVRQGLFVVQLSSADVFSSVISNMLSTAFATYSQTSVGRPWVDPVRFTAGRCWCTSVAGRGA